jgi:hypothetical protein
MKKNKISKESENVETARDKGVSSTDLLGSVIYRLCLLQNILVFIGIISVSAVLVSLFFYFNRFFNGFSNFTFIDMYLFSIYGYLAGATIFEFIIKPIRKKTNRNR